MLIFIFNLSSVCNICRYRESTVMFYQKHDNNVTKCGNGNKTGDNWKTQHIANEEYDINFTGSSPAKEAERAVIMWSQSIERHNIRYKWMVFDGDGKSLKRFAYAHLTGQLRMHVDSATTLELFSIVVNDSKID